MFDGIGSTSFDPNEIDSLADELMQSVMPNSLPRSTAEALAKFVKNREENSDGSNVILSFRIISMFREMSRDALAAKLPRRELRVQWIALGWADPANESMRKIATDSGVSPEAISKMVENYQTRFRLPPNVFNKSQAAKTIYRQSNKPRASKPSTHPATASS